MSRAKDEVYRLIVEGQDYPIAGYNNPTGLYTTITGARTQRTRADRPWRKDRDQKLKIQRARLVWEDVE